MSVKYDESYYKPGGDSQFTEEYKDDEKNFIRYFSLENITNSKSVLELGCAKGYILNHFKRNGIVVHGIDISEWATKDKDYIICGDISKIEYPKAELVYSFDVLEHLDDSQINKVLDKCKDFNNIFHSISVSFEEYGDVTGVKGVDKGHISMHTSSWWLKKFYEYYGWSHYITVFTRGDYVYGDDGKYKFTNCNFLISKDEKSPLHQL